jgi:DNA-binding LacI/PurR family transcriptional regulator
MRKRVTIHEIAQLAKVSTATVSRTINRVPTVDPVLARRIRKVIEKEGYYPISTRINHVANDDEECSAPVELAQIQNPLFS